MKINLSEYGYTRVMAASIPVIPGNVKANMDLILKTAENAAENQVEILVLPELALTGYTCGDLFYDSLLMKEVEEALNRMPGLLPDDITVVFGSPYMAYDRLFNCAIVMSSKGIDGIVPKRNIPNYNEFYEQRWFDTPEDNPELYESVFSPYHIFRTRSAVLGVEICEDLWVPSPPSLAMAKAGATVFANISATPESIGKHRYLTELVKQQSARCRCAYIYASAGSGESSTDLVFSGNAMIAEDGIMLAEGERFSLTGTSAIADIDIEHLIQDRTRFKTFHDNSDNEAHKYEEITTYNYDSSARNVTDELLRKVSPAPFVPQDSVHRLETCNEIIEIQAWGLAQRLKKINCSRAVIGISGGLDSTLALLVTHKTFSMLGLDPKGIIGVTMPGFGTTSRTHTNAKELMSELGVTILEIPIGDAVTQHFKDIGQDPEVHDATYENSQARERTQILMDMANKVNGIVIGTGDLSELALGWCTYNGDHISMYAVNTSIPKTLVGYLVETFAIDAENKGENKIASTLRDIVDTPISPELIPANEDGTIKQKTEDLVGPYELHDFFLYYLLRYRFSPAKIFMLARKAFSGKYDAETILHWLRTFYRRFFSQQFKRSCLPDGPKVGSVCLSPRGDWRMPSDATASIWLEAIDELEKNLLKEKKSQTESRQLEKRAKKSETSAKSKKGGKK